jgi:hypothetical protein
MTSVPGHHTKASARAIPIPVRTVSVGQCRVHACLRSPSKVGGADIHHVVQMQADHLACLDWIHSGISAEDQPLMYMTNVMLQKLLQLQTTSPVYT